MTSSPRLVCLTGQTASGKSRLGMELAEALPAELLSVDSMQVYRRFDIGTAKPSADERGRVRHHGIDLVEPGDTFSAGAFLTYARACVSEAAQRGRSVLAVGGTGLYLRALLGGLAPAPPASAPVRARLRGLAAADPAALHARLQAVDPTAAGRLHPNDLVRIERALEVFELTGAPISEWQRAHRFTDRPFETRIYGIRWTREQLRERIRARLRRMFAAGWVEEVRSLVAAGVPEDATPMRALGYREIAAHLRGELDGAALRERVETASMQFAKRQATWFNREPGVVWLDPAPDLAHRLLPEVRRFLSGEATEP